MQLIDDFLDNQLQVTLQAASHRSDHRVITYNKCKFLVKKTLPSIFDYKMETKQSQHFGYATSAITAIVNQLVQNTFEAAKSRRIDHLISHQMPEDYLKYIGNVSILLHSHREPTNTRVTGKTITEPSESLSHQLHHPLPLRRIQHHTPKEEETPVLTSKHFMRKQSSCLSQRSRMSIERTPTRNIHSRRKIIDNQRLVPLNRATQWQENEKYEQKVAHLRKRKVKLEEAMRAFVDEGKGQKVPIGKKTKENVAQFTTDFKGKIVNFNPKSTKGKPNDSIPFLFKFSTLVQSGRSWNNWGKVSTKRNLFTRQPTNDRRASEADLL